MLKRRYRRVKLKSNCKPQGYQLSLIALMSTFGMFGLIFFISIKIDKLAPYLSKPLFFISLLAISFLVLTVFLWKRREEVSIIKVPQMSKKSKRLARQIRKLFNDKQITDVLKLSNTTRYGDEMPQIFIWVNGNLNEGYVAVENIANWERANREKFEQRVSGVLSGKYQRFAVVNSELAYGDSFIIFHFEDTFTSQRLLIDKKRTSLKKFIHRNKHAIRLSNNLIWYSDITAHLSIIARTRAGKSVFAGCYLAQMMLLQGWCVEYNSAKYDRYVKEYSGQSDPLKIVERAEYWCSVMDERLSKINNAGKEKYLEMNNMPDIGLFFDEIGNLNASLEAMDKIDKNIKITSKWINAINRLSATGASAGIHLIVISQFATKEGFLPSLARVNCSDAVIMLGGAADSPDERRYLMSGFADMPKRSYGKGQGVARIMGSGKNGKYRIFMKLHGLKSENQFIYFYQ